MYSIICASFLQMLETALGHLLEGRQVVEANEDYSNDVDLEIKPKFWSQLQSLLKRMLAASLPSSTGRVAPVAQSSTSNREAGFRSFCPPPHERRGRERPWPVEAVAGSSARRRLPSLVQELEPKQGCLARLDSRVVASCYSLVRTLARTGVRFASKGEKTDQGRWCSGS